MSETNSLLREGVGDDYEITGDFTSERCDVMLQFKGKLPNSNPFE